ncbi:MAG TPA: bifunctional riboflavin kinase/FAD synthetase [Acidimicrobiales bacterium]|jgi:riboflavin kinase/FMN adenylyltransferase|nr:bifunctional riboflavin kinase/FAD synthetase [Acidimicrobiales bacterium]
MDIVTDVSTSVPPDGGSAVSIGAYDGVHLGHRALLAELAGRARHDGLSTVVVTFDRHPATVVRPDSAPRLLCDLEQKLELLAEAGVDRTVVIRFDVERANETAEEFVDGVLVEGLDARLVVVGEDFHFGHGRKGNVALLREMGWAAGFEVDGVSLRADTGGQDGPGVPISSTRIRGLVGEGKVEEAAVLLGRPHQVRGEVVHGDRRGGPELGFPTANVSVPAAICLPAAGIYAGWYGRPDGSTRPAAISVGRRPTFYGSDGEMLVEAHLLDFSGDLYGEEGRVSFVARLRDEVAFDSVGELIAQMERDVATTRSRLASEA